MTKNLTVTDTKPSNQGVVDSKPINKTVLDLLPLNQNLSPDFGTEQFYTVNVKAGQPMGLLLALTYKTAFSVSSSKSP